MGSSPAPRWRRRVQRRRDYTPAADYNGTDSFSYTATTGRTLGAGQRGDHGRPVNDAPDADSGTERRTRTPRSGLNLAALVNDVETSRRGPDIRIVTLPAHGSLYRQRRIAHLHAGSRLQRATASTYKVTDRGDPDGCGSPGPDCDGSVTSSPPRRCRSPSTRSTTRRTPPRGAAQRTRTRR